MAGFNLRIAIVAGLLLLTMTPGARAQPLTVIARDPVLGPICAGPLGPGPCAQVEQYIRNQQAMGRKLLPSPSFSGQMPGPSPGLLPGQGAPRPGFSGIGPGPIMESPSWGNGGPSVTGGPGPALQNPGQIFGGPNSVLNNPGQLMSPQPDAGRIGGRRVCIPWCPDSPSDRRLSPARTHMRAENIPPADVGAYGVVALRAKPTAASLSRLRMACASYLASLPEQSTLPSTVPLQDQMLTIWPLETGGSPDAKPNDCDHLLTNYDLHGGISAIQDADRQGNALTGRGPFLIGWSPSNTRGVRDAVVLVIDMSSIESQQSFDEMFLMWQKRIVENPELWRSGFSAERLRLALRDFVDRYGQSILDSVKLVRTGG